MGAPRIFENLTQAKRLHSLSAPVSRIQDRGKAKTMFKKILPMLFMLIIAGSAAFAGESCGINHGSRQLSIVMMPVSDKGGLSENHVFQGFQTALKEQKMKVLFEGRPLADAEVTISTQSGWEKSLRTDAAGVVALIPIVTNNASDTCSASYKDPASGVRYASDNSIFFAKPPPEWMKKADGFILWALAGSGLVVAGIGISIYRVMKLEKRGMLAFNKYKVERFKR
jgi:hypothetical protein